MSKFKNPFAYTLTRMGITNRTRRNYQAVFDTEEGRYVLSDLCKRFGVFDTMIKGNNDVELLPYKEGQRSVPLFILGIMGIDLTMYDEILNTKTNEEV